MSERYQLPKPPDVVLFKRFPLPPSVNELYATIGRKRVRSSVYRSYVRAALIWMKMNPEIVKQARELSIETGPHRFIHIDTIFYMNRKNIICADGRPKRNDTSNRLKALHDVLSEIIGIDDSYFWSLSADKTPVENENEVGVDVTLIVSPLKRGP